MQYYQLRWVSTTQQVITTIKHINNEHIYFTADFNDSTKIEHRMETIDYFDQFRVYSQVFSEDLGDDNV